MLFKVYSSQTRNHPLPCQVFPFNSKPTTRTTTKKTHWILSLQTRLHLSLISLLRWKEPMTIHQAQLCKISNFGFDCISKMSTLLLTMTNLYDIFAYLLKGDWACIWVIFEPFPFSNTPSVFTDFQMHLFPPETMTTMSN